jgi:hypothetical protein
MMERSIKTPSVRPPKNFDELVDELFEQGEQLVPRHMIASLLELVKYDADYALQWLLSQPLDNTPFQLPSPSDLAIHYGQSMDTLPTHLPGEVPANSDKEWKDRKADTPDQGSQGKKPLSDRPPPRPEVPLAPPPASAGPLLQPRPTESRRSGRDATDSALAGFNFGPFRDLLGGLFPAEKRELLSILQGFRHGDAAEVLQVFKACDYNVSATRACLGLR